MQSTLQRTEKRFEDISDKLDRNDARDNGVELVKLMAELRWDMSGRELTQYCFTMLTGGK